MISLTSWSSLTWLFSKKTKCEQPRWNKKRIWQPWSEWRPWLRKLSALPVTTLVVALSLGLLLAMLVFLPLTLVAEICKAGYRQS